MAYVSSQSSASRARTGIAVAVVQAAGIYAIIASLSYVVGPRPKEERTDTYFIPKATEKPADHEDLARVFEGLAKRVIGKERPKPAPAEASSSASDRDVAELAGAKILIVDDDIRNIYSLTSVLETYDVEVLHAERGKDGILILEQTPGIDIALIDIMMPEMDGYETIALIRSNAALRRLPIIALTAKAMKGDREKCLAAGMTDFVSKPFTLAQLQQAAQRFLDEGAARCLVAGAPSASRSATRSPAVSTSAR